MLSLYFARVESIGLGFLKIRVLKKNFSAFEVKFKPF
jgi:hypothetical protein